MKRQNQSQCHRQPTFLATTESSNQFIGFAQHVHARQTFFNDAVSTVRGVVFDQRSRQSTHGSKQDHMFTCRQLVVQDIVLWAHAHVGTKPFHVGGGGQDIASIDHDRTRGRGQRSCNATNRGRFPRTVVAQDGGN